MTNKKLNKLKKDIEDLSCKGIECKNCPLGTDMYNCELTKFQSLIEKKFMQFKPKKCPNCGGR